jgi:tetratricopeptide (TPR) repeat protein
LTQQGGTLGDKARLAIAEKGDFSVAEKAFQTMKSTPMNDEDKLRIAGTHAEVFVLERKYKEGLREAESLPDGLLTSFPLSDKYYLIGFARKALEDETGARAAFLKAKDLIEAQLKQSPDAADVHIRLARVLAYLGQKGAALAEAQRATELLSESKDALGGPEIATGVAEVHAVLDDNGRAIEILDGLLSRPSAVTVQGLKINPIWDPLRNDPRFQPLLNKYGGKT